MKLIRNSILYFSLYTLALGVLYPGITTIIGAILFSDKANGSIIENKNIAVGSKLIGQNFTEQKYFWGRPSATSPTPYNPASSSGSNQPLTNPALQQLIKERSSSFPEAKAIPIDLVTASGSGLDPEISIASANLQAPRIAAARGVNLAIVQKIISENSLQKIAGLFGEPRVNVLQLNLELDKL